MLDLQLPARHDWGPVLEGVVELDRPLKVGSAERILRVSPAK